MLHILQSEFAQALGWSLVDSLWQAGAVWGVYSLVTLNGKKFSSSTRHNLAILSVFGGTVWFIVSFFINYNNALGREKIHSLSQLLSESLATGFSRSLLSDALPYLSVVYIICVLLYSVTLSIRISKGKTSLRHSLAAPPAQILLLLESLREKINITRNVALWISNKTISPLTTGLFRPMILLPLAAMNNLSMLQLEAVLTHELFHIKRKDYLLNLFVMVCEVLLFFNPFIRLLTGIVKRERENSCDDFVLSMGFDAWQYSQALYYLGGGADNEPEIAIAATGNSKKNLLDRVKRLLRLNDERGPVLKPTLIFFLCLSIAFLGARSKKQITVLNEPVSTAIDQAAGTKQASYSTYTVVVEKKLITIPSEKEPESIAVVKKKKVTVQKKETAKPELANTENAVAKEYVPADHLIYNVPEFISNETELDFTIIIPAAPITPTVILRETPAPYVPGSTFYVPVDSLPVKAKKIIRI